MLNSTYSPQRWNDVEASKIRPNIQGAQDTVAFGTTQDKDILVSDDSLIRGIEFFASGAVFGDTLTIKVVDVDGVYVSAGTVLSTPVSDYVISADTVRQSSYDSVSPLKLLGGLYIRVSYTSTGGSNVDIGVNLLLQTILI